MSELLPDYNEDGSANPKGDAAYWRARAEAAEADGQRYLARITELTEMCNKFYAERNALQVTMEQWRVLSCTWCEWTIPYTAATSESATALINDHALECEDDPRNKEIVQHIAERDAAKADAVRLAKALADCIRFIELAEIGTVPDDIQEALARHLRGEG